MYSVHYKNIINKNLIMHIYYYKLYNFIINHVHPFTALSSQKMTKIMLAVKFNLTLVIMLAIQLTVRDGEKNTRDVTFLSISSGFGGDFLEFFLTKVNNMWYK
ncbi:hypothetical protein ACJX0J_020107 [Zea mays]